MKNEKLHSDRLYHTIKVNKATFFKMEDMINDIRRTEDKLISKVQFMEILIQFYEQNYDQKN